MKKTILFICFILSLTQPKAQNQFFDSPNAYLGMKPPGDTPTVFAPRLLIPDSGISMDRSAWSADGKEFYYVRALSWFSTKGSEIRYFRYDQNKWNGPMILNEGFYAPTFSMNGKSLYFLGGPMDTLHSNVWVSNRKGTGWTEPRIYLQKPFGLYDFMPTRSGTAYVGSNVHPEQRGNYQDYDFSTISFRNGDTVVKSLGGPLNTPGFDGDFYIAPDESFMIVSYHEKPDYECELGISFRKPDLSWSEPQNLGSLINNGDAHRWGEYVSPDGKYLFYSRGTSEKDCALYWVRFDQLKAELRKSAF